MASLQARKRRRKKKKKTKKKQRKKREGGNDGLPELRCIWQLKHNDLCTTIAKRGGTETTHEYRTCHLALFQHQYPSFSFVMLVALKDTKSNDILLFLMQWGKMRPDSMIVHVVSLL
jgi:hypothetical protein